MTLTPNFNFHVPFKSETDQIYNTNSLKNSSKHNLSILSLENYTPSNKFKKIKKTSIFKQFTMIGFKKITRINKSNSIDSVVIKNDKSILNTHASVYCLDHKTSEIENIHKIIKNPSQLKANKSIYRKKWLNQAAEQKSNATNQEDFDYIRKTSNFEKRSSFTNLNFNSNTQESESLDKVKNIYILNF